MANQTRTQRAKPIVRAILAMLVLATLLAALNGPARQLNSLSSLACTAALELLPSVVPAAWQAVQGFVLDHHLFCPCTLETLVSFGWPLLRVLAGAA